MVEHWETVSDLIVEREGLLSKLEAFESVASDPNRFFEKGCFSVFIIFIGNFVCY